MQKSFFKCLKILKKLYLRIGFTQRSFELAQVFEQPQENIATQSWKMQGAQTGSSKHAAQTTDLSQGAMFFPLRFLYYRHLL